jgi:hypothetical protein
MTLILSAVAGEYAIQVSDRRLTDFNGRLYDDEANKAVLFCGRMAFSYTGLGFMGRKRMDDWLTQALVNARTESLSDAVYSLAQQATVKFKKIGLNREQKRHAFVSVGWARLRNENFLSPILCSVSNAHTANGEWMTEAEDEFTVHYSVGPGQSAFSVLSSGQTFPVGELSKLRRKIRRCLEHNTGPEPVVKYLVQDIHRVAARNRTVGRSMMVVSLPKQTASSAQQMFLTDLAPLGPS